MEIRSGRNHVVFLMKRKGCRAVERCLAALEEEEREDSRE